MVSNTNLPFLSCNLVDINQNHIKGVKRSIILIKSNVRFLIIETSPNFKIFFHLLGILEFKYIEKALVDR
ncbi:MAG: hypothetical protein ACRC92_17475 [Peptostreptococcaceae bacterium]